MPNRRLTSCSCGWSSGTNAKHAPAHKDTEYDATPTRFYGIMRCLFPALLRLAAGSEPVGQQLFRELVLALVHWFTRSARKCADLDMASVLVMRCYSENVLSSRRTRNAQKSYENTYMHASVLCHVASHAAVAS